MRKSRCPICSSIHTIKYGVRKGDQIYRCQDCKYQFRNQRLPSSKELWHLYQDRKQTIAELAEVFDTSPSTIKRRLCEVSIEWEQPPLSGGGYVHIDATYWGHNWGIMLAIDSFTGRPLYLSFIKNETIADYQVAIESIRERGYEIKGIIIDGKQSLFKLFSAYKIQMCQYHMKQIVRRYLTLNPRLKAARALKELMDRLTTTPKEEFVKSYEKWKNTWSETLQRRSVLKNGQKRFRHRRLRSAMNSIDYYLPYLFTYQECTGMPNTNNKIEGSFTDLKKNLNNHSGMSKENKKRFICGFFLAWNKTLSMKEKQDLP